MSNQAEQPGFVLTRRLADGKVEWTPVAAPAHVPAVPGEAYALIDRTDYEAPQALVVERQGDDLVVEVEGTTALVLDGFFATADVAFYPTTDIAGGAGPFSGSPLTPASPTLPGTPQGEQVIWAAEGVQVAQSNEPADHVGNGASGSGGASPLLWGGLAVGGLGLALAAGGGGGSGGGSGGDNSGGSGNPPPADTDPPEITSATTATTIAENSGAGQVVYTATATDAGAVTWSLGSGGDAAAFSIDPDTGAVTLTGDPDFESQSSYTFTVVATDAADNSSTQPVSLSIEDVDDSAPAITSSPTATPVDENSGASQVVYAAAATGDGPVSWSLAPGRDAAAFTIDAATGAVTLIDDPDFETKPSYDFTVVATDADDNSGKLAVTLTINDLDEVAPTITSGDTAAAIDESSGANQVVYSVTSTDDGDISAGSTTYALGAGDDAESFAIDADTGAVTLIADPDYEAQSSYAFTVVATDTAGNSSEQAVSLAINNVDEGDDTPPRIDSVALTGADGAQNGLLNAGDIVTITVTTDENVIVHTTDGTPQIQLSIGGHGALADYVDGSGTTTLTFQYTIQDGDNDSNGIRILSNRLDPNGGTMIDTAGNALDLHYRGADSDSGFIVDTTAPVLFASAPADDATDVPVAANIVLAFPENLIAGSGVITISDGTDIRTIDVTDSSQVSIAGNLVTINPSADLEGDGNYSVQIDAGAFTDAAGNAYAGISDGTTLNFQTESDSGSTTDTSIVVFDLLQGSSSAHSDRSFDSDVSYDIYIRVDSDDSDLSSAGNGPGSWGTWAGAENLGSDDRVILVGSGDGVQGRLLAVDHVSVNATTVAWQTGFGFAAGSLHGQTFVRSQGGDNDGAALFDSSLPGTFLGGQGGAVNTMYLTSMPAGILTSQGLA